jgi:hypothetical protein
MQIREELGQKGHDGSRKTTCHERGKKYHFQKGGGINIVFGLKYRPLSEPNHSSFHALLWHHIYITKFSLFGHQ